ncbi:MAG: NAD(P)-dependent dehydrogenase (short-subunit alcohol dehydrogenase family) [Paracoccaceae bacterium]|jgi:NAD(P)-dependent dehydrogenase (short-subunit alcohol dehydrogenase family)
MHIVITGGSRGIGAAIAKGAAARGWDVTVNYVSDRASADAVADAVRSLGARVCVNQGDMASEADVIRMYDEAEAALGPVSGVVVNAGIVGPTSQLADMSVERMRRIFDVNILGAFMTVREAARRMSTSRGGKGGSVVNISSVAARLGSPNNYVDYAASKGAVDVMTIGLSKELGPEGVRVNSVRPGIIDTDIHASGGEPDRAEKLGPSCPMGRAGSPEEIANSVLWLLSDEASYVTGAIVDVTGGR